ncbi:MAG TPA: VWA domain-containing protein [Thermoanaerobaculia bacterium]|jgi:VWFA-related protein|nr:VWA domain-containing protein [Thermoanaerobaculia bacterium]
MRTRFAALFAASLLAAGMASAQEKPEPPPKAGEKQKVEKEKLPEYADSAGSEYVLVPVVVLDKKGRFVEGLERKDFQVRAQGSLVALDTFEKDDSAPVSWAFLIDTSGSMRLASKLDYAKSAIRHIIAARKPGDDFALFAFAEDEVNLVADFSRDTHKLLAALNELEAGGKTALFDAVAATPSRLLAGKNGKRAIVLFTDGVDNASRLTPAEMAEILQQVSIPVYAIGMKNASFDRLTDEERNQLSVDNLRMLAASSGGKMYLPGGEEDLSPIAEKIGAEVRKQYLLGFTATGRGELKYRLLVVSVLKRGSWDIRARRGYRGTAPVSLGSQ